ncbi:hypothetical protein GCM10023168_06230 [Fodinibacter luteus]|uniref:Lycopene cyclase domain-containing protein n=1 Tax=Fodinibacter luteus TaxID=552064 RepID=A0ABP8K1D5_9MICO
MPEYTALAVLSVLGTVAVERFWLRTGVFRRPQYWIAMGIVYFFMVLVDGWLTKLSAPIVIYAGDQITGIRVPWDIPVEDYLFGFSMITLTLLVWLRLGERSGPPDPPGAAAQAEHAEPATTRPTPEEAP